MRIAFETKAKRSLKLKRLASIGARQIAFYIVTEDEILHYISFI
ncbi:hypothetical protein LEP1GSC166_2856 [Leptospira kirschneri]|nr:hypothetical protein LEP1GSC166_2856 [Leptospira kirschneri]